MFCAPAAHHHKPTTHTSSTSSRKRRLTNFSLISIAAPAATTLLLNLPTTAQAFVTYREVLEPHPHDTSNLPMPLSDLSVAFSMAPNVNGDLTTGIYLIGGCQSDYISYKI